jgi:TolB-like protein
VDPERHRRAQTLFEQAEALPLEKRETLLATIGADDPVLRREVARLLEAAARMAEDFLEPSPTSRATRTRVGETLAHYRILDQLGVGGMGEVYLAEDERLKRRVALKVLPPDLAGNPERLERFQREAETVAALNHPNIVTIYSIENEGGVHFLTMELVEGPTLRRLIDHSGALPIEDVLDLGVQISEGLAEAHAAGITHRDLKPGNVMVAQNDRVKLLDFGLARADQSFGADAALADPKAEITKEGTILGTIAYMSPEQVMGRRVTTRSDVFSLGILLFELATGKHPFLGETETSTLAKILERKPLALLEARPGLPRELEQIVGRCLEKDPTQRYQDTAQLARELRGLVRARGSPGPSTLEAPQARGLLTGGRRGRLAATSGLLIALGGLGLWSWMSPRGSRPIGGEAPSVAVLPLRNISEDPEESAYLAEGLAQAVTTKLTQAGLRVTPRESVLRAREGLSPQEVAKELGVSAVLLGTFQLAEERIHATLSLVEAASGFQVWAQDFDGPLEDLFALQSQIALEAAESLKGKLTVAERESVVSQESQSLDAYDYYLQGAHFLQAQDLESTEVARQYFERAVAIDPDLIEAQIGLGAVHSMRYFNSWGGIQDLQVAEERYLAALRLDPVSMRARRGLMRIEWDRGRPEEVLIQAREARRAGRPDDVESLLAEAQGYAMVGLNELSLPVLRRVLELDPLNEAASWWLVLARAWSGEFEAAVEAGEAYVGRFGDDGLIHTWIGVSHYVSGRLDRAEEHYQKATTGRDDQAGLLSLLFRGHLQQESGRQDEARSSWEAGLEAIRSRREEVRRSPRLLLLGATFEACLGRVPSPEALREILDQSASSPEVAFLAAGLARAGDWQRSAEVLRGSLDRGSVLFHWRGVFNGLGLDSRSAELGDFVQAFDARALELSERFGPSDPVPGVSARE